LKVKTNIGTKLSHFDTWHNGEITRVKNSKKIQKNSKKIQKKNSKKNSKNIKKNKKKTEIDTWH